MAARPAVLVDGDNISAAHGRQILEIARGHGTPGVVRVYGNAQCPKDWHEAWGYRMIHAGSGKNASDLLLAIDAMELALARGVEAFVVATSDGDFSHLAHRLRELGTAVIGVGEAKAPASFRGACSRFVELAAKPAAVPAPAGPDCDLDRKIKSMIALHSKNGAGLAVATLSARMHVEHDIRISTYPERSWRAYLAARPDLYDLDPRGPEAMVRFRPQGFAALA
ncbi:NYN domain-containing protein [Cereibacter sphaeroides]|uniref:NYN domain-containing protein n=1 Tax=Cereibacter sphaeroides TaxID=1063 RepID=UPI000191CE6B|nr:NYN domain-containing protein [Cereibacter sphaeroides]ACM03534.1 Hypothetical Protein RSKD131_3674 [Cereibacter sphaeroides KD131]EKX57310.1 hypothetical protein D516_1560 [Rhodobacter sp. AKP1]